MRLLVTFLLLTSIAPAADPPPTHDSVYQSAKAFLETPDQPFDVMRRKDVEPILKESGVAKPAFTGGCYLRPKWSADPLGQLLFLTAIDGKKAVDTDAANFFAKLKVGDKHELSIMENRGGKWVKGSKSLLIGTRRDAVAKYVERKKDPVDGWERVLCEASTPPLELYSHRDKDQHTLMLKATYAGDDWVFAESVKVSLAGETFEVKPGPRNDPRQEITREGGVEEVLFLDISERPDLVAAILKSTDTAKDEDSKFLLRFQGKAKFADKDIRVSLPAARIIAREYYCERFGKPD